MPKKVKVTIDQAAVTAALQLGGLVLFAGGHDPFRAGFGVVLTDLIDLMSHSQYSHSAIAMPARGAAAYIYESTITSDGKINGPQRADIAGRVADYGKEGGHAWILPFLPPYAPDWNQAEAVALQMVAQRIAGKLPYNVTRLFKDAQEMSTWFDVLTLPEAGLIDWMAEHSKGVVCSEMAGLVCQGGQVDEKAKAAGIAWLPKVKPPGQPIGDTPADLAAMPIHTAPVQMA
jgi:hypothetical protein